MWKRSEASVGRADDQPAEGDQREGSERPAEAERPSSDPDAGSMGPGDPYDLLESVFREPIVFEEVEEEVEIAPTHGPQEQAPQATPSPQQASPELESQRHPAPRTGSQQPPDTSSSPSPPADELPDQLALRVGARLDALEAEVRNGSARTMEALRRLGERLGSEFAMLDKRAINLELTVARLRTLTEAVESTLRRHPEAAPGPAATLGATPADVPTTAALTAEPATEVTSPAEPRPGREPAFTLEEAPAAPDPDPEWEPPSKDLEPPTELEDSEPPQASLPGTQPSPSDWRHPSFGPPPDDEPPDDL